MYLSSLGGVGGTVTTLERVTIAGLIVSPVMAGQFASDVDAQYGLQTSWDDEFLFAPQDADGQTGVRRLQERPR